MIDLHIHTVHSDGQPTVKEILKLAEENKLDYIAFTDHDAVSAFGEVKELNIIVHTVVNNLTGIYHGRVEYPKVNLNGLMS